MSGLRTTQLYDRISAEGKEPDHLHSYVGADTAQLRRGRHGTAKKGLIRLLMSGTASLDARTRATELPPCTKEGGEYIQRLEIFSTT